MKRCGLVLLPVIVLFVAACSSSPEPHTMRGALAVADTAGEWYWSALSEARYLAEVESGLLCFEIEDQTTQQQCLTDQQPYLERAMGRVDCSEGIGGGYGDIHAGTQVIVSNASGEIVALGSLSGGRAALIPILSDSGEGNEAACIFDLAVEDIPPSEFYSIAIAGRDPVVERFDDLEANDWEVEYLLGFTYQVVRPLDLSIAAPSATSSQPKTSTAPSTTTPSTTAPAPSPATTATTEAPPVAAPSTTTSAPSIADPELSISGVIDCAGDTLSVEATVENVGIVPFSIDELLLFPGGSFGHAAQQLYTEQSQPVVEPGRSLTHAEDLGEGFEFLESGDEIEHLVMAFVAGQSYEASTMTACP